MGDSARIIGTGVTQVFDWNMKSTKRYTINPGGTSSSKTVSILQVLIMLAREFKPGAKNNVITVTAESLPALKAGAIRDFEEIIAKAPFSGYIKRYTVSPHKAILHNGAVIEFRAFKDVKTAHHGKRRILFINEANNMNYAVCRQLMMRSRRIFMDFNPTSEFWAHQKFQGHPEAQWIYSTYKHNAFTPKETIAEILALKTESPELYRVYGLGRKGNFRGQIFNNIQWIDDLPIHLKDRRYGMDLGFTNSYTALIEMGMSDGFICAKEHLYERHLTTPDIITRMDEMRISKSIPLVIDNANPATIEEIRRKGYNAIGCAKKDVSKEVQQMLGYKWKITADSISWKKEAQKYMYQVDKATGEFLNVPIKMYDHCFTAGQKVETDKGLVNIESIQPGDMVLTEGGYRPVIEKHTNKPLAPIKKYLIATDKGNVTVTCTINHKIKINDGWEQIQNLKPGNQIFLAKPSTEKNIIFTTVKDIIQEAQTICTRLYGCITTALCRKASKSTTSTEIRTITESKILPLFRQESTCSTTWPNGWQILSAGKRWLRIWTKSGQRLPNGTAARMASNGTGNTRKSMILETSPMGKENALCAVLNTRPTQQSKPFVPTSASLPTGERLALITLQRIANCAAKSFKKTSTPESQLVPALVVSVSESCVESQEVYDLSVWDCHNYTVNGLLVSNCWDAARYAFLDMVNGETLPQFM